MLWVIPRSERDEEWLSSCALRIQVSKDGVRPPQ